MVGDLWVLNVRKRENKKNLEKKRNTKMFANFYCHLQNTPVVFFEKVYYWNVNLITNNILCKVYFQIVSFFNLEFCVYSAVLPYRASYINSFFETNYRKRLNQNKTRLRCIQTVYFLKFKLFMDTRLKAID